MAPKARIERVLERGLFAARWLMAPFYLGLVVALGALVVVFFQELMHDLPAVIAPDAHPEDAILMALSLIDLSLAANLVLIVTFSGYENFISRIDVGTPDSRPDWMGTVDFAGLKMKLIASIVAISAIALLRAFMKVAEPGMTVPPDAQLRLYWLVVIHITFVISGLVLALMDWASGRAKH